ncbi:hypothetical protein TKK_0013926 [Trichogramma kaykai]
MMISYIEENHKTWDEHIYELTFAFNTAVHDSTGVSPAFLNLGRNPEIGHSVSVTKQLKTRNERKSDKRDITIKNGGCHIQNKRQSVAAQQNTIIWRKRHCSQARPEIQRPVQSLKSARFQLVSADRRKRRACRKSHCERLETILWQKLGSSQRRAQIDNKRCYE